MRKTRNLLLALAAAAVFIIMATFFPRPIDAGSLEPPGPIGPTMKTLDEIPPTWSQKLDSTNGSTNPISFGCGSSRFKCIWAGEAVLDKETGLVWTRDANRLGPNEWIIAYLHCRVNAVSDRRAFRLPTLAELSSLMVDSQNNPSLPAGHPFQNVQITRYWTSTPYPDSTTSVWAVNMSGGIAQGTAKTDSTYFTWCVRGGSGQAGY